MGFKVSGGFFHTFSKGRSFGGKGFGGKGVLKGKETGGWLISLAGKGHFLGPKGGWLGFSLGGNGKLVGLRLGFSPFLWFSPYGREPLFGVWPLGLGGSLTHLFGIFWGV